MIQKIDKIKSNQVANLVGIKCNCSCVNIYLYSTVKNASSYSHISSLLHGIRYSLFLTTISIQPVLLLSSFLHGYWFKDTRQLISWYNHKRSQQNIIFGWGACMHQCCWTITIETDFHQFCFMESTISLSSHRILSHGVYQWIHASS